MTDQPKMSPETIRDKVGSSKSAGSLPNGLERDFKDQRYVDITAMIRSLQRTEGLTDCFRSGLADCDQLECSWRQYCLEKAPGVFSNNDD